MLTNVFYFLFFCRFVFGYRNFFFVKFVFGYCFKRKR